MGFLPGFNVFKFWKGRYFLVGHHLEFMFVRSYFDMFRKGLQENQLFIYSAPFSILKSM